MNIEKTKLTDETVKMRKQGLTYKEISKKLEISETKVRRLIGELKITNPKLHEQLKLISYKNNPAVQKKDRFKTEFMLKLMEDFSLTPQEAKKNLEKNNIDFCDEIFNNLNSNEQDNEEKTFYEISSKDLLSLANIMLEKKLTIVQTTDFLKEFGVSEDYIYYAINKELKRKFPKIYDKIQEMINEKISQTLKTDNYFNDYDDDSLKLIEAATIDYGLSTRKMVRLMHLNISVASINYKRKKLANYSKNKETIKKVIYTNTPDSIEKTEIKQRVLLSCKLFKEGFSINEISKKLDVSYDVIYRDLTRRLEKISPKDSQEIKEILKQNKLSNLKNQLQKEKK